MEEKFCGHLVISGAKAVMATTAMVFDEVGNVGFEM